MKFPATAAIVQSTACRLRRYALRWRNHWFPRIGAAVLRALRSLDSVVSGMQQRTRARIITTIILLLPVYLVGVAASPGIYTGDSRAQLNQALSGVYQDWNPPIMSALWSKLIAATGAPESLLWLHLAAFAVGILIWVSAARRAGKVWAVLFLVMSAFGPQLLNFLGVLWKDVGFALAMFVAFAVAVPTSHGGKKAVIYAAGVLILAFYAVGVRANGFPAVVPLLFVVARGFMSGRGWRTHTLAGGAAVVGISLLIGLNWGLSYRVLDAKRLHPEKYIQLYDLTGISVRTGVDLLPAAFKNSDFTFSRIAESYKPTNGKYLFWASAESPPPLKLGVNDSLSRVELRDAWVAAIRNSPLAYLSHRTDVFLSLMRIGYDDSYASRLHFPEKSKPSMWPGTKAADSLLRRYFYATAKYTVLYFGWFWLLVLTASTVVGYAYRREPLAVLAAAQAVSGLLYMLPYYLIAPASDFRYLYWSVFAGTISASVLAGIAVQDVIRRYGRPALPTEPESAVI